VRRGWSRRYGGTEQVGRVQADDLLSAVLRVDERKPALQADPLGFQRLDPVDQGLADGGHVAVDLDGDPVQFTLIQRLVPTTATRPIRPSTLTLRA
jgi:hypothetical protein